MSEENTAPQPRKVKITSANVDALRQKTKTVSTENMYAPYEPPPGVLPKGKTGYKLAMDSGFDCNSFSDSFNFGQYNAYNGVLSQGYAFPGFQLLAQWSQIIEFRKPCEVYAREMTRKWIKLMSVGDDDKSEKIAKIEAEFKRLNVQAVFREAIEHDGMFGRAHIFLDMGTDDSEELKTPLMENTSKIAKNSLKRLAVVEPVWLYPGLYNSTNPLSPNFYKPTGWYCMGEEIHSSRLCTIVTRELPDILKPAYSFAGLSLQQIMKPYIDNWLLTRQNISDLIQAFTVWVLKTDLSVQSMGNSGADFYKRLEFFNLARDNHGVNAIDNATEEFSNISAPIQGLDQLQAQAQEHQCAPSGLPLVYLTGITPAGLNASSQDEIEVFQDTLHANQELYTPHLSKVLNIVQLSLFGEIDPDIGFEWEKLKVVSEKEIAEIRKMDSETDIAYADAGVLAPDEIRSELANEENSRYASLDLNRVIEKPEDPSQDPEMQDFNESIGGWEE